MLAYEVVASPVQSLELSVGAQFSVVVWLLPSNETTFEIFLPQVHLLRKGIIIIS
jgi:hypothetical protein